MMHYNFKKGHLYKIEKKEKYKATNIFCFYQLKLDENEQYCFSYDSPIDIHEPIIVLYLSKDTKPNSNHFIYNKFLYKGKLIGALEQYLDNDMFKITRLNGSGRRKKQKILSKNNKIPLT